MSKRSLSRLTGVLSIGKVGVARDQQLYYEQKVARGADDYYAGRGESPGRWMGSAARQLGLTGELDAEQLKAVMDGRHPGTGVQLSARGPRSRTAAFDLTFSAPKSVSVLFAVGDERMSRALVEAHEEAVDAALTYLEREACRIRRGHNGTRGERAADQLPGFQRARVEPAAGFVAAAYRHRMSRAQDPQLHTHVVCANMAQGRDGRWTALDGRAIYQHAKAAGCLYEAHLRQAVRERLPWAEWGPVRNGIAELVHVPEQVRVEFSQRRRRILDRAAELEAAGVTIGRSGRERIVYDTREPKREVEESGWREQVRARAAEHGLGRRQLERMGSLPSSPTVAALSEHEFVGRLLGPNGLTARRNTFHKRDVMIALADAQGQGAGADLLSAMADTLLRSAEVVPVAYGIDSRYTTRELLEAEGRLVRQAEEGLGREVAMIDGRVVDRALERLPCRLSSEQREAVVAIVGSGNRIDALEALAGTGKTTCAAALRAVYEQAGYRVLGAAPTGRAVRELKERAGIRLSRTLDSWLLRLSADPRALSLDQRSPGHPAILVIDEAGMAHTRASAAVIDRALASGIKVIAIGDSGQLSSVQAGGWLAALSGRVGARELREVMRQRDPLERRALAGVHQGEPDTYLQLKQSHGQLHVFTAEEPGLKAEETLVERWMDARGRCGGEQAAMICRDNARRERLNGLARARLRERGELGESIQIGERRWAVGERVIARRNDRVRDLDNGMRGTVDSVDEHQGLVIRLDAGGRRQLDVDYVRDHLEHAYALTAHGMQGATVDWAGVIGQSRDFSRNWSYTALSRARDPVELFLVTDATGVEAQRAEIAPVEGRELDRDALTEMAARMRERDDEDLALEQLERAGPEVSPLRERIYELAEQLDDVGERLRDRTVEDARTIIKLRETIAEVERVQQRERRKWRWRDRAASKTDARLREHHLANLREHQDRLLGRVPDPDAVLQRAAELREQQIRLSREHRRLYDRAIDQELAARPPWLENTLGSEPDESFLRERWQRTARELAGHRIRHHITDPNVALDDHGGDRALRRSIGDMRAALGLEREGREHDLGYGE